jgi:predicted nucleic acid-binding protein
MMKLYVIDTNALIHYYPDVFDQGCDLSRRAHSIIKSAFTPNSSVRISIPSVVLIEIYDKWFTREEFARKFYYEVFLSLKESPNIEIKPIEQEVLENLLYISGDLANHEIHDKIILASAMMLKCSLITSDAKLTEYVTKTNVLPEIFF